MASTYTTNLGIEKPGTGEQSGTWGTTANTNYDLIDQAINGIVQVTLASSGTSGSPNSLSITNGSASDGRNKYIEFIDGGDLGATAYVQLDPNDAEKIVHMRNSLSGSRSVIVFQGTYNASNDFEIPAGKDVVLKFDGAGAGATVTQVFVDLKLDALDAATVAATTGNITTVNATTVDTTNIEVTNIKAKDGTSAGSIADSTGVVTFVSAVLTTADINGGTMDGVTIGGASAAAGTFSSATVTGDLTVDTNTLYVQSSTNRVGIGTTSPAYTLDLATGTGSFAAGNLGTNRFTSINASGQVTIRYNNNGLNEVLSLENNGLTALGQGVYIAGKLAATGEASLYSAGRIRFMAEGLYTSTTSTQDAKIEFMVAENGVDIVAARMASSRDVAFFDSAGNENFYWDASTKRIGLGVGTNPTVALDVKSSDAFPVLITRDGVGGAKIGVDNVTDASSADVIIAPDQINSGIAIKYANGAGTLLNGLTMNGDGYVAIGLGGLAEATAPLHVYDATGTGNTVLIESANDTANNAPNLTLQRSSASPAANDLLGQFSFRGKDSGGNTTTYTNLISKIIDATDGSEDGAFYIQVPSNAGLSDRISIVGDSVGIGGLSGNPEDTLIVKGEAVIGTAAENATLRALGLTAGGLNILTGSDSYILKTFDDNQTSFPRHLFYRAGDVVFNDTSGNADFYYDASAGTLAVGTNSTASFTIQANRTIGIGGNAFTLTGGSYSELSIAGQGSSTGGFIWAGAGSATTNADFDLFRLNVMNADTIVASIRGTTATGANDDGRLSFFTKATGGSLDEKVRFQAGGEISIGVVGTGQESRLAITPVDQSGTMASLGEGQYAAITAGIANTVNRVTSIGFNNSGSANADLYAGMAAEMTSGAGVGLGDLIFFTKKTGANGPSTQAQRITSGGNVHFYENDGTSSALTITGSNGFVMVGDGASADARMHVYETTGAVNLLVGSGNAGGAYLILDGDADGDGAGGDYAYIVHSTAGNLDLYNLKANQDINFNTSDGVSTNTVMSVKQDHLLFPSTYGIKFDAAGDTLAEYEEGTVTIGVSGSGGPTISSQTSRYIRIGNTVLVNFTLSVQRNTATGSQAFINMPYAPKNLAGGRHYGTVYWDSANTSFYYCRADISAGSTTLYIRTYAAASANQGTTWQGTDFPLGSDMTLGVTICYEV